MDSIFQKFGIYDFLGIWGSGAISVTYFIFTLYDDMGFSDIYSLPTYAIIILYTAVAYVVGVILHELGKIIADLLPCFHADHIKQRMNVNFRKRPVFIPFHIIKYEYQSAINKNISLDEYKAIHFDKALNYLKYKKDVNTRRIDTYHSVYALARSLCLCFLIHAGVIVYAVRFSDVTIHNSNLFFVFDIALAALFYIRAYRYYHSWVKNIFIQYDFLTKEEANKFRDTSNNNT